ncbi:MAG: hypothetical protein PHE84_12905 [bacterium]|nr:hypothetical protein [bacterium]
MKVKKKAGVRKRSRRDPDELAGFKDETAVNAAKIVTPKEMAEVWDAVAGPGNYTARGTEAYFYRDGASWTIVGANAPIINPTVLPKKWPVKGTGFAIEVLDEPVYYRQVLPFRVKLEGVRKTEEIYLAAAPDSFVPASFVIRSGDADLERLMVEASSLRLTARRASSPASSPEGFQAGFLPVGASSPEGGEGGKGDAAVPAEDIDVRLVKCWYQAGIGLSDTRHKTLMPELLLHDNDLVRVDYERQVNLLKNLDRIQDADTLKPFSLPKRRNQQVWLTIHVREGTRPGFYEGTILVSNHQQKKELKLTLEVLPLTLPDPMLFYGLYYTGRLADQGKAVISAERKSAEQMRADFADLAEHGIADVVFWPGPGGGLDSEPLQRMLELRKGAGLGANRPLLSLDTKNTTNPTDTRNTTDTTDTSSHSPSPISQHLPVRRSLGEVGSPITHDPMDPTNPTNAFEFFARGFLSDLLDNSSPADLWVINDPINDDLIADLAEAHNLKKKVYLSASPPAGREEAELYRNNYGFKLFYAGADGVLAFAYQGGGGGDCWNDFRPGASRPQVMAYPAVNRPIPTLQWEGWREGVNDVRYLTLLYNKGMREVELKGLISAFNDPDNLREIIINKILAQPKSGDGR